MAYNEITNRTSPNFWRGRSAKISGLTIHWWGDPATNPTAEGVVNWLCNPQSQASAHFVVTGTGRRVWQLVNDADTAWHATAGNPSTIGLELDPRCRNEDYDVAAEVIADLWRYYGKLPLYPHRHWNATACPGNYDLARLQREAENKLNPPKPAPAPTPTPKVTYAKITKKSIELIRDANLWNFNFTKWADAKAVKGHKKGEKIDNIVAIATNALGAKYYMTEYSYNDGKIRSTNGFNINDAKDWKAPTPVEPPIIPPKKPDPIEPTPEPAPEPEKPVAEEPFTGEEISLLKRLVQSIMSLINKLTGRE